MKLVRDICVTTSRCLLAGWVFAAILFVVTTIREVRSPDIESTTKSHLAEIRFPPYYQFGFTMLVLGSVASVIAFRPPSVSVCRFRSIVILLGLCLVLMTIDYIWIFGPMNEMTMNVQVARPAHFADYHRASMQINSAGLVAALSVAAMACWPLRAGTANDE